MRLASRRGLAPRERIRVDGQDATHCRWKRCRRAEHLAQVQRLNTSAANYEHAGTNARGGHEPDARPVRPAAPSSHTVRWHGPGTCGRADDGPNCIRAVSRWSPPCPRDGRAHERHHQLNSPTSGMTCVNWLGHVGDIRRRRAHRAVEQARLRAMPDRSGSGQAGTHNRRQRPTPAKIADALPAQLARHVAVVGCRAGYPMLLILPHRDTDHMGAMVTFRGGSMSYARQMPEACRPGGSTSIPADWPTDPEGASRLRPMHASPIATATCEAERDRVGRACVRLSRTAADDGHRKHRPPRSLSQPDRVRPPTSYRATSSGLARI